MFVEVGEKVFVVCYDTKENIIGRFFITVRTSDMESNQIIHSALCERIRKKFLLHPDFKSLNFKFRVYPIPVGDIIDLDQWDILLSDTGSKATLPKIFQKK